MKKYKAKINLIWNYEAIIYIGNATLLINNNEYGYDLYKSAKRAAERVAKKLGIGLEWK